MTPATRRVAAALLCAWPALSHASDDTLRADDHAPIGVMGDHTHEAGELMFSYRYSRMSMDDNRSSTGKRSAREVVGTPADPGRFTVVPTQMEMQMHMLGAMYAPHDRVTLTTMVPILELSMDHLRRDGVRFETESSGLGDIKAGALVNLFRSERHRLHLNTLLSIPTGSIDRKDDLPAPAGRQRLPYPMQLGSGTWDLTAGATWRGQRERWTYGLQGLGTVRTGRNSKGYRLGDRIDATTWLSYGWTDRISSSARLAWTGWGNIHGDDDRLNPALVPTADPNRRGGHRLDVLVGLNLLVPLGPAGEHRLALEYGRAAYQWLDGPQLDTPWRLMLGWQSAFDWKLPAFGD